METLELYEEAARHNIPIISGDLKLNGSASVQIGNQCVIGIDPSVCVCERELRAHLTHELGHCLNGGFYSLYSPLDIREKHEVKADKWAIQRLISKEDYEDAIHNGINEVWSLAEYFNVPEDFMRKAMCLYKNGNLDIQ